MNMPCTTKTAQRYARELLKLCAGEEKEEVERVIHRFATLLIERRQGNLLPEIIEAVEQGPEPGAVNVMMTTAAEPDLQTVESFREALERKLDAPVHLRTRKDASLIGGATLRYEDVLFDGSLRRRLDSLKQQLSQ